MSLTTLTQQKMIQALTSLDQRLNLHHPSPVTLIVGGGGAMVLAHQFPIGTSDIDAVPKEISASILEPWIKEIAAELNLPVDWLNPYFSTFAHTLPSDYALRLISVFQGQWLSAQALGAEDLLIMKCFAHRRKDVGHARALLKKGLNLEIVETRIAELQSKKIPHAVAAQDFLEEILELEGR